MKILALLLPLALAACDHADSTTVEAVPDQPFFTADEIDALLAKNETPPPVDEATIAADWLRQRMALSQRHLLTNLDDRRGDIPYFDVNFETGTMQVKHAGWDWCDLASRYALAARMLARHLGLPGDAAAARLLRLEKTILQNIRRDGLAYRRAADFSAVEADIFDQGSVMLYLVDRYRATGIAEYRAVIEMMIRGLSFRTVRTEHGRRFLYPTYRPDGARGPATDNWNEADPCHHGGRLLYPLALFLEAAPDSEAARRLFDDLANYVRLDAKVFAADGSFAGHTHSRTNTLLGLLIRARQTGDADTAAQVRRSVDWLVAATPRWGWVPEFLPAGDRPEPRAARAETDGLADLLSLLLLLAKDDPAYWDVVERYVRNGLAQAQWTAPPPADAPDPRGIFCGYCDPNGFGARSMNCCSPAGALALAAVREAAATVSAEKGTADYRVFLPLARDDENVRITSAVSDNRLLVTLVMKKAGRYHLRVPADGRDPSAGAEVLARADHPGQAQDFAFSLKKNTEDRRLGDASFQYDWLGPFVTRVAPAAARFGFFLSPADN
ncbi:MAG: hypothetical protein GX444_09615 [Myxococcales bacterium]|nr:hypothetical protein [Myxococcales bacterium]